MPRFCSAIPTTRWSRNEVVGIGKFQRRFGKPALEVAFLVADVQHDPVAGFAEAFALGCLVVGSTSVGRPVGPHDQLIPFEASLAQVFFRGCPGLFAPPGDEYDGKTTGPRFADEGHRARYRGTQGLPEPLLDAARALDQIARARFVVGETIELVKLEIRQGGFVDVENHRDLAPTRGDLRHNTARFLVDPVDFCEIRARCVFGEQPPYLEGVGDLDPVRILDRRSWRVGLGRGGARDRQQESEAQKQARPGRRGRKGLFFEHEPDLNKSFENGGGFRLSPRLRDLVDSTLGQRLRQVRAGAAEGIREARRVYAEELKAAAEAPPEPVPAVDPVIAGYYANLEIEVGSDLETVTRAWKRLVREYHPDRYAGTKEWEVDATRLVQELNRAYRELTAYLNLSRQPLK